MPLEYNDLVKVFATEKQGWNLYSIKIFTTVLTNQNQFGGLKADEPQCCGRGKGQHLGRERPAIVVNFKAIFLTFFWPVKKVRRLRDETRELGFCL